MGFFHKLARHSHSFINSLPSKARNVSTFITKYAPVANEAVRGAKQVSQALESQGFTKPGSTQKVSDFANIASTAVNKTKGVADKLGSIQI